MVVYPALVASAYATFRLLRDVLGCKLPIEIWFSPDEIRKTPGSLAPLHTLNQTATGDFLFKTPEFVKMGAVFWPDYWHPQNTMFYINSESVVWQLLDMPFVDMFEQESGQLLIDRRRHSVPLHLDLFHSAFYCRDGDRMVILRNDDGAT
ncbi:uncharacterized protein PITG_18263 [Phytophthora infestans T30-4]|uniref:Uncharacterized protein n=1 Tax=Phytophthora infestans (strain T30-4) TaxID=403677 RepID=D0NXR5_PHYIT|nr:uncharacterized protein PITG_18263 [Phytophthora infestans T30-4]EEY67865.1 conserved hypothetical protein [Phytophthora infestans T30-4]|eukprot:XP_002997890.1 conserved hypothetical protein [Phytophthora infestans T30-4]